MNLTQLQTLSEEALVAERRRLLAEFWKRGTLHVEGAYGDVELALILKAESQEGRVAETRAPGAAAAPEPPRFWGAPPPGRLPLLAAHLGFAGPVELVDAMRGQEKDWRRGPEGDQARRRRVEIIAAALSGKRFRRVPRA